MSHYEEEMWSAGIQKQLKNNEGRDIFWQQ